MVGLDARTGELRWQTKVDSRGNTSGPLIVEGKVISGGACAGNRANCYISAHDALTGKEVWRFYTTPAVGEPGDESWAGAAVDKRLASTWGLPGAYDPVRKMLYWGVANPMPDQRSARHDGNPDAVSRTAPADLYSNSTIALDPATGKLAWYYQHLPGDDWDSDYTHERTLVRTRVNPDPKFVKWINPDIPRGQETDLAVTIGEGGGVFVLDRSTGKFLWAEPFPFDTPDSVISGIDVKTGKTSINWNNVFKTPGETHTICYWNTRSYWPTAYSPVTNSLYTSYIDNCRQLTTAGPAGRGSWKVVPRPGSDPNALTGLAKINLSTGEILRFDVGRAPGNGAMLATAGGLVFHGDMSRRFRAFDAETGKQLWESILGGNISVSTISYAVNGKQYICVMTGDNLKVPELAAEVPEMKTPTGHNAIYVFSLPSVEKKRRLVFAAKDKIEPILARAFTFGEKPAARRNIRNTIEHRIVRRVRIVRKKHRGHQTMREPDRQDHQIRVRAPQHAIFGRIAARNHGPDSVPSLGVRTCATPAGESRIRFAATLVK